MKEELLVAAQLHPMVVAIETANSPPAAVTLMTGSLPTVKLQFAGGVVLGSDGESLLQAAASVPARAHARRVVMGRVGVKRRTF